MSEGVRVMEGRWRQAPPVDAVAEEREWIRRCQQGDERAFRELMARYRGRAYYLAAQILRDRTEAEDIVQEAFLRVFRSIRQFRGDASFHSWLHRIIVNLCMDRRRRKAASVTLPLDESLDLGAPLPISTTRLEVDAMLSQLSDELRITLLLREVVGLSYTEIAGELGIPVGTVRSRLSAAREQFRRLWIEAER